jgi:NADPH2:quinone reductase
MRAVLVERTGGPEVLRLVSDVLKPSSPGKGRLIIMYGIDIHVLQGQLLVRNRYSGVNFIDTYHRTGLYPLPVPFTPGRYVLFI